MPKRLVTLDMDTAGIRLLEVVGERVERWASLPLEPEVFKDGVIVTPATLSAAIKQLMKSSGIKKARVIASLSGLYSISRVMSLPQQPREQTRRNVEQAMKELMPIDGLLLSWRALATNQDEQQVFILGLPRDIVNSQIQALKKAGVSPAVLELQAIALARVVNRERAIIFNIAASAVDIVIVVDGIPQVMVNLSLKGGVPPEERMEEVVRILERTVAFYDSQHPEAPLSQTTPIFLTGQIEQEPALREMVQERTGCPVESIAPPLEVPPHLPLAEYAVNLGLAARELQRKGDKGGPARVASKELNILTEARPSRRLTASQLLYFGGIIAGLALAFLIYQQVLAVSEQTAALRATLETYQSRLTSPEITSRLKMTDAIQDYQTLLKKRGSFAQDITLIHSEAAKLGIEVSFVSHKGNEVEITSQVSGYVAFGTYRKALEDYVSALVETGRFSSPSYPELSFPPREKVLIKAKVNP